MSYANSTHPYKVPNRKYTIKLPVTIYLAKYCYITADIDDVMHIYISMTYNFCKIFRLFCGFTFICQTLYRTKYAKI